MTTLLTTHPLLSPVKSYKVQKHGAGSFCLIFTLEDGRTISAPSFPTEYCAREYAALFCNLRH